MNSNPGLAKRLLSLYPVKLVREEFASAEGNVQELFIADACTKYTYPVIKRFALNYIHRTKQHVYIFELNRKFKMADIDITKFPIKVESQSQSGDETSLYLLPKVTYTVITTLPDYQTSEISFLQPLLIRFVGKHLIFQTTILEKNIEHYYNGYGKVFIDKKVNEEDAFIKAILEHLQSIYTISVCDLHKGVKTLWNADKIDSVSVRYRKNKSAASEIMDEGFTVKEQYPDIFTTLLSSPLNKTIFKYLCDDEKVCRHFSIEPRLGQISVSIYPDDADQINHTINEILQHN